MHASRKRNTGPIDPATPAWLAHYLANRCDEWQTGLGEDFFRSQLDGGDAIVLLDGLDEAASHQDRKMLADLMENAATAYKGCRFVMTSRPGAYKDDVVLPGFNQVQIDRPARTKISEIACSASRSGTIRSGGKWYCSWPACCITRVLNGWTA